MKLPHFIVLAGISLMVFAACGGDGPGEPTATSTVPPAASETPVEVTPTPEPSATPTATPEPLPPDEELVLQLARSASYLIYTAAEGDTLAHVAYIFGGVPGRDGTLVAFLAELQELNQLETWDLQAGQIVAVPLMPESTGTAVLSSEGLWLWLTIGGVKELQLYGPSDRLLNDGYQGALTVQSIELLSDAETGAVNSYWMQFAETDRPVFKGGELDPAAVTVGRAFDLYCGPIKPTLEPRPNESVHTFNDCLVVAPRGELEAETIAGSLVLIRTFVD